jgi:poly-beta-1,6-N-acetyl-D-glucosamine synthase
MTSQPFAVLASEIPSPSATFVFREIAALRRQGVSVRPFALRAPAPQAKIEADGLPFLAETSCLYGTNLLVLLALALIQSLRHPVRTLRTLGLSLRDSLRGSFSRPGQRWRVFPQALVALALARKLEKERVGHLHVHFAHAPATVGMYAARAAGISFSVTGHAHDLFCEGSLLVEKILRAELFRTISKVNRQALIQDLGEVAEAVVVLPCGVAPRSHRVGSAARREPARFLLVARLVPKKGADLAVRALGVLSRRFPNRDWRLDIVGDGPERGRLRRLAESEEVGDRVVLHGAKTGERLAAHRARAGAFVLPCRQAKGGDRDGIPLVLMEALAEELPVITSKLAGPSELIEDEVTGLCADVDDVESLAQAMQLMAHDRAFAGSLARQGRRRILRDHDVDQLMTRLAESLGYLHRAPVAHSEPEGSADLVIITPFRDELEHLPRIVAAMKAQTRRPRSWILVDDGSSDGGDRVAKREAECEDWIHYLRCPDRGARVLGSGVIEAFNRGLKHAPILTRYIAKMDADLSFGPRYIERALLMLEADSQLACVSGKVYRPEPGGPVEEFMIDDMVAGQFKLYRRDAFDEVGGFVRGLLWDGIDYHRCRQRGWRTRSDRHPDLRIAHHRLMGSSDGNVLRGRLRLGRGQWFMGTHPIYLVGSALFRMLERPYVVGGILIVCGYLRAMLWRLPRYEDQRFRSELRRWQLGRLRRSLLGRVS